MPKSANQKLKLLYILKILSERTDEEHAITTQELIKALATYDISAERKSIYNDIACLCDFGYDIVSSKNRENGGYYLAGREFELAQLKLLVDTVQASKVISRKKSDALIKKLEQFVSCYQAKQLQRDVFVADRPKTENEAIYYSIDTIHEALNNNLQISFIYSEWGMDKQLHPRKDGERYLVSPFRLVWNDSNYYLVAFDEKAQCIKHFRVDKMSEVKMEKEDRTQPEMLRAFNPAVYAAKMFGMYGGEEEIVRLECDYSLVGVIIDRFGTDISLRPSQEHKMIARVNISVSPQFFGWICGLGKKVQIVGPESVKEEYKNYLQDILKAY